MGASISSFVAAQKQVSISTKSESEASSRSSSTMVTDFAHDLNDQALSKPATTGYLSKINLKSTVVNSAFGNSPHTSTFDAAQAPLDES